MRIILFICLFLPGLAAADDWKLLNEPGAMAIMRHALAPGTSDPIGFDVQDCSTQRNLDARGRAQAKAIGSEMRARGITFKAVHTSQWCRCRETADLLDVGPVSEQTALNSFFQDRSTRQAQTEAARQIIHAEDPPILMVTHQVNITALTDVFPKSGEIVVIRAQSQNCIEVLGTIEVSP